MSACLAQLPVPSPMIRRGGIAGAIRYLGAERSPESIIVDISGAEMPASQIHDLAELCEPGVTVIAIGDRNDIGLYRDLVKAGVSEYIVKPVTAQLLAKALIGAPASDEGSPISRKLGKVVAVVGSRGGVGATTLAIHLALHLANQQSRRVMLLDLDLQTGDCALALNLRPTPGLREALANPLRIDSVFLDRTMALHGERLFVLSAEEPLRADAEFTAEAVETLVGVLRTQFHYIIADVPRIPGSPYWQALDIADLRIIVADQTLRSVRDTVRLREALQCRSCRALQYARRQPERRGRSPGNDLGRDGQSQAAAKFCNPVPAKPVHRTRAVATRCFDGSGCSACRGNFGPRNRA